MKISPPIDVGLLRPHTVNSHRLVGHKKIIKTKLPRWLPTLVLSIFFLMGTVPSMFGQEVVSTIPAISGGVVYICTDGTVTVQIDNSISGKDYRIGLTAGYGSPINPIEIISGNGGTITSQPIDVFPQPTPPTYTIIIARIDFGFVSTFNVDVTADPTAPTLTLSQSEGAVNASTSTSISATAGTAGSGGVSGSADGYKYSIDGGATWSSYVLGDPIPTTTYQMPSILIKAFRSHPSGLGCYAENIYTWTINSRVHDGTGATGSYYNIQDAINASATASGDILLADDATYVGNIEINKSITLKSGNLHGAVIQTQSGFNAGSGYGGITFLANNATLEGFRIEQSVSQAVIHTHNSNYVTIKNNEVVGTAPTPDDQPRGVDIGYAGVNSDHVTIQGNTFTNTACGAYVNQATNVTFDGNTLALVSGSSWPTGAVVIDGTWPFNNVDVTNNTINSATDYLLNYGSESNVGKVTYSGNTLNNGKLSNWIVRNIDKEIFYETLNGATNNANANDHINIDEGTTSISTWTTVNKTLTIQGAGITKSIVEISPSWFNNGNQHALTLAAANTSIKGVKFLITGKGSGNILGLQGNNLTIEDNRFEGAYVFGDGQVSRATVWSPNTGISFKNNEIESLRQPGYISGSSGIIDGNSINNTRGWVIETVGTLAISNNTFGTNIDHIAILAGAINLSGLTITGNDFSGSATWYIENQDAGNGIANASCNWYGTADYSSILAKIKGKVTFVPYQSTMGGSCDMDFAEPANLTLTYTQASEDIHVKFDVTNNNLELKEISGGLTQAQVVALYQNLAAAIAGGDPVAIHNAAFAVGDDIITEYYYMDGMTKKYLKTIGGNELAKNKYWDKYLVRTSDSERFPDWGANKTTVNVNEYGSHTNPGTGSVSSGWLNDVLGRDVYVTVTFIHDGNVKSVTKTVHIDAGPIKNLTTGYGYHTIQQAIDASNSGDRIGISTGTYTENVDATAKTVTLVPGNSPGCVTINGNLTLNGSNTLEIEANGTVACTLYDQFIVNGTVTLNGAILDLTLGYTPSLGDNYTVIDNDGNDAVIGKFSDMSSIKVGGDLFRIDYKGGTGNDVVVTKCSGGVENTNTGKEYCSIQDAINEASAGDIIKVTASSFTEPSQIVVDKDVTIKGNGKTSTTVINNFTKTNNNWQNDGSAWIVVNDGVTATFKDMKLDGNGKAIPTGILFRGGGTVSDVHMTNISDNTSYNGSAIRVFKAAVTVTGSKFDNIGRSVIHVRPGVMVSSGVTATITNNTFTGNGLGDKLNYAADVASGSNVTITGNTMSNFKGQGAGYGSAGLSLYAFDNGSESTSATIKNNFMDDNYLDVSVGPGYKSGMILTVEENSFTNTIEEAIDNNASVSITAATCNWYGSSQLSVVSAKIYGNVTYIPWLNNGSDNDGMSENGFQPVANSCNWSPVGSLTVSSTPESCAGNDGTIKVVVNDGPAPYNVAWSGGSGTTSTDITFINISNGTYVITVTDNYGNTTTASVAVGYTPVHNTTQNTYYTTIQAAINASSNDDVIDVCKGTYNELLTIDKSLTLNGAKKNADPRPSAMSTRVIDDASESIITGTRAQTLVTIKADNVVINGFEFKQTGSGNTAAIVNNDKSPKYTDLTFKNNIIYSTGGGNAMRLYGGDNFLIERNYLQDIGGEGIVLRNGNNQTTPAVNQKIKDNDIKNVGGVSGGAINVYGEKDLEISGNIIDTKYQGISIGAGGPSYYDMDNINVHHNTINWNLVNTGGATKFAIQVNGLGAGVNIHNNIIQQTGSNPSAGYPLIRVGYDTDNSSVTNPTGLIISDNYLSMVSGGTGHYMYIGNNITNAITGTCNWWGTTNATTIASYIRDVNGKLTYAPWYTSGGNNATIGFDPTGQCNGSPVTIDSATPTSEICSTKGSIQVNWTGGVANYTVAWSGTASGNEGSLSASPYMIAGLTAGTYIITVTDSYSNSAVSSIITVGYTPVQNTTQNTYYTTIQGAIDASSNGDVIVVCAGTYTEAIIVNKGVTIQGPNAGTPGTGSRVAEAVLSNCTISMTATNATLDGFHILQTNDVLDVVLMGGSGNAVINNIIERNGINAGKTVRAISVATGSTVKTVSNNLFTGDVSGGLFGSHKTWNNALYINGSSNTVNVTGNTFKNSRSAMNVDDMNSNINISGNTFENAGTYISFGGVTPTTGSYTLGTNEFKTPVSTFINNSNVSTAFRLDITSSTINGAAFNTLTLVDLFNVEATMYHRSRSGRNGLVYYVAKNLYVRSDLNNNIQTAVDYAAVNDVVNIMDGTYNQRLTVNKSLTLDGQSKTGTILDGSTGVSGTGSGIAINTGVTSVTVRDLTVQNYAGSGTNLSAGIYGTLGNNNLIVDNVVLQNNTNAAGFFANGPVDAVSVTNSMVNGHGPGARGIVIWNGHKTNINISNNMVSNNNCCGIELSDGSGSAVTISNNTIDIGGGDNAIGLIGLDLSLGSNTINNNTITGGGRFGIEIKNPAGGVTVSNNYVELTSQNADLRDRAGIAVIRRGVLGGNVDVPNGVLVTGNTVKGYQQSSVSEGFGIVIEGTNHTVTGNTLENNEVGILQQQNPSNYPGDADQSNVADQYFGRGNSPWTCGNTIGSNIFITNGLDYREIGVGIVVTNITQTKTFCSINMAIEKASANDVLQAVAATYNETVVINKPITLKGANAGKPCDDPSRGPESIIDRANTGFTPISLANSGGSPNVTIDGFEITGFMSNYAIYSGSTGNDNISIVNNNIHDIGTGRGSGNVYAYAFHVGAANRSGVNITDNCLTKVGNITSMDSGKGSAAIWLGQSNANGIVSNISIERNKISKIYSTSGAASGIDLVAAWGVGIGGLNAPIVKDNNISEIQGGTGSGVGYGVNLAGKVPGAEIKNNWFDNITGTAGAIGVAVPSTNSGASTDVINNNSFTNISYALAGNNSSMVNATCNWYGTCNGNTIASKINGNFTYVSWLMAGDNSATIGFVPTAVCSGTPIVIDSAPTTGQTCDANDGTIIVNWSGGITDYTLTWSGGSPVNMASSPYTFNNLVAGTYSITITDNCGTTASVSVVVHNLPVHNLSKNTYHTTIQAAIDAAGIGDEIDVCAGTYAENIIVDQEVTILGPNANVDPCTGTRGAEAIILPATAAIDAGEIFHVAASNVTIKGFTIDGDNPALTSGFTSTNGADIDAAEGITVYETGINNLTVTHNIIQNLSYTGVTLYDYPAGVASAGNTVSNNKIQDLGTYDISSDIANWGIGVLIYNNQYTAVTNNCMTNVRTGVQTGNFYRANPGNSSYQIISNNTIKARRTGIFHNLAYSLASPYTVSDNTITATPSANEVLWRGILVGSMSVDNTYTDNDIDGTGLAIASEGINVWNVKSTSPAQISGGTISNVTKGIFANNFEGYNSNAGDGAHAVIDGVTIQGVTTGIQVYDSPSSTSHAAVKAEVKNVTIGGNTPIGVLVSGNAAYANVHDNDITADAFGIQATGSILSATNGLTLSDNDITMTGQTYNSNPTSGIVLHNVTGTAAATVSGNDIDGSMYGYSVYKLNTGTSTDITGGTITGVMQGVAMLNWDPVANTYGPTNANVSNISMSGFTGTSSNPDINFHAGVYTFTGGSDNSASITSILSSLTIDGTGKIQADCGGIVAADFSTGAGTRQTITINENTIQNNANRGILARGGNAIVNINRNTLTNNGGNPYGLGGNDGFGIIGHKNVQLNIWNNFITNPASVMGGYNVSAMANFNGASITATENNLDQNGNSSSWLANNMDNTGTFTANCNWWGSSDLNTILSKQNGNVIMCTYLTDGMDGSGNAGFQPSVACQNRVSGSITYIGSGLLIQNSPAVNVFMNGVDGIKPYTFEYNINGGATQTAMTIGGANNVGVPQGTSTPGTYVWHLTKVTDANGCEGDIDVVNDEVTIVVIPLTDLADLVPTHGNPLNAQIGGTVVDGYIIIKNGGNGPTFDVNTFGWPKIRVPKSLTGFVLQYDQGATMSGSVPVNNWDCTWTDKGAEWEIEYKNNPINAGSDIKIGYTIKGTGVKPTSANMNVRVVDSTGGDNNHRNNKNTRVFIVK